MTIRRFVTWRPLQSLPELRQGGDAGLAARFAVDEAGQDAIEYALLGALVGIVSIGTWELLVEKVFDVYSAIDADVQDLSACTPDPGAGGRCP